MFKFNCLYIYILFNYLITPCCIPPFFWRPNVAAAVPHRSSLWRASDARQGCEPAPQLLQRMAGNGVHQVWRHCLLLACCMHCLCHLPKRSKHKITYVLVRLFTFSTFNVPNPWGERAYQTGRVFTCGWHLFMRVARQTRMATPIFVFAFFCFAVVWAWSFHYQCSPSLFCPLSDWRKLRLWRTQPLHRSCLQLSSNPLPTLHLGIQLFSSSICWCCCSQNNNQNDWYYVYVLLMLILWILVKLLLFTTTTTTTTVQGGLQGTGIFSFFFS